MVIRKVILCFPYRFSLFFSFGLYSFIFFWKLRLCIRAIREVRDGVWSISRCFLYSSSSGSRFLFFFFFDFLCRLFNSKICFFFKVNLVGLGFNVYGIEDMVFRFYLGHSHYIYLFPGFGYKIFCNNKNKFLVVGFSQEVVGNMLVFLIGLRKSNIYKMCGVYRQRILRRFKDNRHNK